MWKSVNTLHLRTFTRVPQIFSLQTRRNFINSNWLQAKKTFLDTDGVEMRVLPSKRKPSTKKPEKSLCNLLQSGVILNGVKFADQMKEGKIESQDKKELFKKTLKKRGIIPKSEQELSDEHVETLKKTNKKEKGENNYLNWTLSWNPKIHSQEWKDSTLNHTVRFKEIIVPPAFRTGAHLVNSKFLNIDFEDLGNSNFIWTECINEANSKIFGFDKFLPLQKEAINAFMAGYNVFVSMSTGAGKSLCYQLPSICVSGTTVVVSPLIALMADQLRRAHNLGIPAAVLSSSVPKKKQTEVTRNALEGKYKLLYITPERVGASEQFQGTLQELHEKNLLSRVVIDEAHCISEWGYDFRPNYRKLALFKKHFPSVPVMCLSASATPRVTLDIVENLDLRDLIMLQSSFYRSNLFYEVRPKKPNTKIGDEIANLIKERFSNQSGIIYCLTTKDCETLSAHLQKKGVNSNFYHGDLSASVRHMRQKEWTENNIHVLCTTTAFGLGIDKPDIRFVFHHAIPSSLEAYYQQSGRAGRDGKHASCILFYSTGDRYRAEKVTFTGKNGSVRRKEQLDTVLSYCQSKKCRHQLLVSHFGEKFSNCGEHCDNCKSSQEGRKL